MNNRLTRIIDRWVDTHSVHGVAALLEDITMDGNDEDELELRGEKLPVTVYNDVDDECMFPKADPTEVPAIGIVSQSSAIARVRPRSGVRIFEGVEVALSYLEREEPELKAKRRGDYVITALADSLERFNNPTLSNVPIDMDEQGNSWRTMGGYKVPGSIEVVDITKIEQFRVRLGVHKVTMYGAVIVTCTVHAYTNPG